MDRNVFLNPDRGLGSAGPGAAGDFVTAEEGAQWFRRSREFNLPPRPERRSPPSASPFIEVVTPQEDDAHPWP